MCTLAAVVMHILFIVLIMHSGLGNLPDIIKYQANGNRHYLCRHVSEVMGSITGLCEKTLIEDTWSSFTALKKLIQLHSGR